MYKYQVYEWLREEYIKYGTTFTMQQVKRRFGESGMSDSEIIEGYVDFYFYAQPELSHLWGE